MTGPTLTRRIGPGQGDLKHAYDGVQQWAVEVVLMRMGVPEEYVQYQTKLAALTRTAVITPFGVNTEKFICRRASGLPQGVHTAVHCGMASLTSWQRCSMGWQMRRGWWWRTSGGRSGSC